jgi:predicted RNase H-like HicB family nuclease
MGRWAYHAIAQRVRSLYVQAMNLTAVFVNAPEGGYTAFIEEIPGAVSEGETMEEARLNLADALRMVLECNREIAG